MIEAAVEMDDDAMAAYLDGKEPDVDTLKRLIRKATVKRAFYPMLCGSAFKNKGVQPLLDAVVDYLPSPADRDAFKAHRHQDRRAEPCASRSTASRWRCWPSRSWTIRTSARSRSAACIRALCRAGMALANTTRDRKERVGRMYLMHANHREQIEEAYAGDIIALRASRIRAPARRCRIPASPCCSRRWTSPTPSSRCRSSPRPRPTSEKMGMALPSWPPRIPPSASSTDQESGETIIKGMGELHLDIKVDILKRTHKVEANVGAPQVAYRETFARATEIDYTHKKQTGGTGQFAASSSRLEPNEAGNGNEFESEIVGGVGAARSTSRASRRACRACGIAGC